MKKTITDSVIKHAIAAARTYRCVWVTTTGQIFIVERDANEAVRTLNMIIDEPDDYVGIAVITADMVSPDAVRAYGRDPEGFAKLFDNARIPRASANKAKTFEKTREPKLDISEDELADIEAAFGGNSDAKAEAAKAEAAKAEAAKVEQVKSKA